MRSGGQILVDHLAASGVKHLFMVPGESFLPVLDALHAQDRVAAITTRNESGAAMMAEATGKLTGRPGVAIVTRGPGAANAVPGVYVAAQDQSPLVLLVGLAPRAMRDVPAFQRIDLSRLYGGMAKSVAVVETAASLQQHLDFAFRTAVIGRRGPVVLGLPEDVLADVNGAQAPRLGALSEMKPRGADIDTLAEVIARAKRPLVIAGSPAWSASAASQLGAFAQRAGVSVATAFRRQDRIDNAHVNYAGHLGFRPHRELTQANLDADVVVALGACLDAVTTGGFKRLSAGVGDQRLVLVAPDAHRPDPPYVPDLAIEACPMRTIEALASREYADTGERTAWVRMLRAAYERSHAPENGEREGVLIDEVFAHLNRMLAPQTIVCSGAGNYAAVLHRYFHYRHYPTQLAPVCGSMGYGLPAAIAASLDMPGRRIVAVAGDGCFQMTGGELATAVQWQLPILTLIIDNGTLGTIREAQLARDPARVVATTLVNPDFAALARAHGALGLRVTSTGEFPAALDSALAASGPAVIHLIV